MPKEVISVSLGADDCSELAVQWGAEGKDVDTDVLLTSFHKQAETIRPDDPATWTDWEPGELWSLDRKQINKLIRVLRRARDQAYGRDE